MSRRRKRKDWSPANKFVKLDRALLECDAYRDLSSGARDVLHELMYRYNGHNNGSVVLSVRQAAARTNCTANTAMKRLLEVEDHGFARCSKKGAFKTKVRHASEWVLTMHPLDGEPAAKDFMRWKKQNAVAKTQTERRKNSDSERCRDMFTVSNNSTVVRFSKP